MATNIRDFGAIPRGGKDPLLLEDINAPQTPPQHFFAALVVHIMHMFEGIPESAARAIAWRMMHNKLNTIVDLFDGLVLATRAELAGGDTMNCDECDLHNPYVIHPGHDHSNDDDEGAN